MCRTGSRPIALAERRCVGSTCCTHTQPEERHDKGTYEGGPGSIKMIRSNILNLFSEKLIYDKF
jgi:hypothetical protein